jgi:transposase-like protein
MKTLELEQLAGMRGAAGTEGARRATGVSAGEPVVGVVPETPPDPEVPDRPKRRRFKAEDKRRILLEADACTRSGELGALLRREGLYSSSLSAWRAARKRGEIAGLAPKKRGPKATPPDPRDRRLAEMERENGRLKARVERAEGLIAIQKKVSEILGIHLPGSGDER